MDLGPAGLSFLGTVMGVGFRGEGWFVWRKARSLFGHRGTHRSLHFLHSALNTASPGEAAASSHRTDTCLHLSKHRGEKLQRKGREIIYI